MPPMNLDPWALVLLIFLARVVEIEGELDDDLPVEILFLVEKRRQFPDVLDLVLDLDPHAVCTTTDVRGPHLAPGPRPRIGFLPTGWRARSKRK